MNAQEHAIVRAKAIYERNGMLPLTNVMELSNMGLDVPALEHQWDTENEETENDE